MSRRRPAMIRLVMYATWPMVTVLILYFIILLSDVLVRHDILLGRIDVARSTYNFNLKELPFSTGYLLLSFDCSNERLMYSSPGIVEYNMSVSFSGGIDNAASGKLPYVEFGERPRLFIYKFAYTPQSVSITADFPAEVTNIELIATNYDTSQRSIYINNVFYALYLLIILYMISVYLYRRGAHA